MGDVHEVDGGAPDDEIVVAQRFGRRLSKLLFTRGPAADLSLAMLAGQRDTSRTVVDPTRPPTVKLTASEGDFRQLEQLAKFSSTRGSSAHGMRLVTVTLLMALLEISLELSDDDVREADAQFADAGLPTLTAMRHTVLDAVPRVLARGEVVDDLEFYAVTMSLFGEASGSPAADARERLSLLAEEYERRTADRVRVQPQARRDHVWYRTHPLSEHDADRLSSRLARHPAVVSVDLSGSAECEWEGSLSLRNASDAPAVALWVLQQSEVATTRVDPPSGVS